MALLRARTPFSLTEGLLAAYATNQRITDYLLENLDEEAWRADPPGGKGRTIAAIVAHMHNVRLMLLKMAKAKRLPAQLDRFKVTKVQARKGLQASHDSMAELLASALEEGEGRVPGGVHREAAGLFTQLVNHEAHHRGQICTQARLVGHPLTQEAHLGMWDWSKRANERVMKAPPKERAVAPKPKTAFKAPASKAGGEAAQREQRPHALNRGRLHRDAELA